MKIREAARQSIREAIRVNAFDLTTTELMKLYGLTAEQIREICDEKMPATDR